MLEAILLSFGTELTLGHVQDTNAPWLAERLGRLGFDVRAMRTVPDDPQALAGAIAAARAEATLVIATGGLGPTPDDLTREAVAQATGVAFAVDEAAYRAYLMRRARPPSPGLQQEFAVPAPALDPDDFNAGVLANPVGVAHGFWLSGAPGNDATEDLLIPSMLVVLPGVPREMTAIYESWVAPLLKERMPVAPLHERRLMVMGLWEPNLAERLGDLLAPDADPLGGDRATAASIELRFVTTDADPQAAIERLDAVAAEVRRRLGAAVYGEDDATLAQTLAALLVARGLTLAVAESCTGGLVADRLTDVPGSSAWFLESAVTYSNAAKSARLGVPEATIAAHGAVSPEVARAMAEGAARCAGSSLGVATTGIAGPTGGTKEKPVGLVYVGVHRRERPDGTASRTVVRRYHLGGDRRLIKERAAACAINLVRLMVLDALDAPDLGTDA